MNQQQKINSEYLRKIENQYRDLTPDTNPTMFGYDKGKYKRYFTEGIQGEFKRITTKTVKEFW